MSQPPREQKINVESIYGLATKAPLVNLTLPNGRDRVSLAPDEARDLALNLLEAAEAALGDGFVLEFFTREMGLELGQAAPLMVKFRGYRTSKDARGT